MPSTYLQPGDYPMFGLSDATTVGQVNAASALIDLHLKRPDGLVWTPDGTGAPGWMAGKAPAYTLKVTAHIPAGVMVPVQVPGTVPQVGVGDVFILDRASATGDSNISEVVTVQAITPPQPGQNFSTLILASVVFDHPGSSETPVTMDAGLVIKQHKFMPDGRPLTNLAFTPVIRLISGQGRYGYARRGDASRYMVDEFNLLAAVSHFGGPPVWEFFPMTNTNVDPESGQLWVPAGVMLSYYTEVNLWYVAGFQQSSLPYEIKQACATLIQTVMAVPQLGDASSYRAGDTAVQNRTSSVISKDTADLLSPYAAKLFG